MWYRLVVVVEIEQRLFLVSIASQRLMVVAIASIDATDAEHGVEGRAAALYILVLVDAQCVLPCRERLVVSLGSPNQEWYF